MEQQSKGIVATILRFVSGMRFPWLFALVGLVFGLDVLFPDILPFADELLLGLLTLLLAAWRKRKDVLTGTVEGRKADPSLPAPPVADDAPRTTESTAEQSTIINNG